MTHGLVTYKDQVGFARRWLKEGRVERVGTWHRGSAWGHIWCGKMGAWRIWFKTIGDGPYMRAGSFRVGVVQ